MKKNSDTQRLFTSQLFSTARTWRKLIDLALVDHGISEACAAPLLWIGRLGGGVRQTALADYVGIESPSLVRLLDQLESLGLVMRKDDPTDRRAKGLWLTDLGQETAARIEAVLDSNRAQMLAHVSPEDLDTALRVLMVFQEQCGEMLIASDKKD